MHDSVDANAVTHPEGASVQTPHSSEPRVEVPSATYSPIDSLVVMHQQEADAAAIDEIRLTLEQLATPPVPESLSERSEAFLSRAQGYRSEEIDFIDEHAELDALKGAAAEAGIVIVGEMHGTVQNADMLYNLCKKLGIRRVALEYPRELQATVDSWLAGGTIDFASIESFPDGRITAEQFAVLKQLKKEGLLDEVICMDAADDGTEVSRDRDEAMATNVLKSKSENAQPILAMAGNYHTDTVTHEDSEAPNGVHEPFGYRVGKQVPGVPTVTLHYRSGSYHNYGPHDFVPGAIPVADAPLLSKIDQQYHLVIPEATIATVPAPHKRLS